jgi:hypothetical protein
LSLLSRTRNGSFPLSWIANGHPDRLPYTLLDVTKYAVLILRLFSHRAADQVEALNAALASHYASVQSEISTQYQNTQAGIAAYKGKGVELSKGAQEKIHGLTQGVIAELEKIQSTTASLPAHIQATFKPLTDEIGSTLLEVKSVVTNDAQLTMSDKVSKVSRVLKEHIGAIVEKGKEVYATAVDKFLSKKHEATDNLTNGSS